MANCKSTNQRATQTWHACLFSAILLGLVFNAAGCTSISSTFLQRQDDDALFGISNGKAGIHQTARPFKGIPVTLKIPTHLDISVVETLIFVDEPNSGKLTNLPMTKRHLDVVPEIQVSDKVFTVDLKRPAAGTMDYEIEFQDGKDNPQYFNQVSYHVVDQTLKDITGVIANLKPISPLNARPTGRASGAKLKEGENPTLEPMTRTVAWKRFDLNSVSFEDDVLAFVNLHLNDCHSCGLVDLQKPMELHPECISTNLREPISAPSSELPAPIVRRQRN